MRTSRKANMEALFELMAEAPEGRKIDEMAAELGLNQRQVRDAIRDLRQWLGEDDTINLPCDPAGHREQWTYRLAGKLDETQPWVTNRLHDMESRLMTTASVAASLVRATDGRGIEGKKARIIHRALSRAQEDLGDL